MKATTGWNVTTVLLLAIIALGIYLMPRFNYQILLERTTAVEARQTVLEDKLRTLNLLAGSNEEGRTAVLRTLDTVSPLLASTRDTLAKTSEQLALHSELLDTLERRLSSLELNGSTGLGAALQPMTIASIRTAVTTPVDLSSALREKAEAISSRSLSQWSFAEFIEKGSAYNALPFQTLETLSPEVRGSAMTMFLLCKSIIDVINYEESLYLEELVIAATRSGNYEDVPIAIAGDPTQSPSKAIRGVLIGRDLPETGVRRFYRFPLDEHPEFEEYNIQRDNVRDNLVRNIFATAGASNTASQR